MKKLIILILTGTMLHLHAVPTEEQAAKQALLKLGDHLVTYYQRPTAAPAKASEQNQEIIAPQQNIATIRAERQAYIQRMAESIKNVNGQLITFNHKDPLTQKSTNANVAIPKLDLNLITQFEILSAIPKTEKDALWLDAWHHYIVTLLGEEHQATKPDEAKIKDFITSLDKYPALQKDVLAWLALAAESKIPKVTQLYMCWDALLKEKDPELQKKVAVAIIIKTRQEIDPHIQLDTKRFEQHKNHDAYKLLLETCRPYLCNCADCQKDAPLATVKLALLQFQWAQLKEQYCESREAQQRNAHRLKELSVMLKKEVDTQKKIAKK